MAASDVLLGLLSGASGYLQGRAEKKRFEELQRSEQAKQERESASQQELRKMAMAQALLGSEFVTPEAKNRILATVMPEFQQTRETQERVAAPITEPPVQIGGFAPTAATNIPPNIPLPGELPRADLERTGGEYMDVLKRLGVTPDAQIIERELQARQQARETTPVSMPLAPRGEIGAAEIKPAEGFLKTETVTEPIAAFQEKPTTARTEKDELATGLLKEGYSLYPKMTPEDRQKFVTSLDAFRQTKNPADIYLPSTLPADTSEDEKRRLNELLIQQRTATSKAYEDLAREKLGQIGAEKPLTPVQKVVQTRLYANDVIKSKPVQQFYTVRTQAYKVNNILDDVKNQLNRGVKQEIALVAFQKALDEMSVAREGEVARTIGMQSFLGRAIAGIRSLVSGGKLTDSTIESLRNAMNIFGATAQKFANQEVEKGRDRGASFGLNPDQIAKPFKDFPEALETAETEKLEEKVQTPEGEFGDEDIDKLFEE